MGYEDIIGQQFDIVGQDGPYNGNCPPGMPVGSLGNWGYLVGNGGCFPYAYPAGQAQAAAAAAAAANAQAMAFRGGYGQADIMGQSPNGNGNGNGGYGYGYGPGFDPFCFGPPVAPHLVQKVEEPAVLVRPRCPTRIRTEYLGFPRTCIRKCETVTIECDVQVLTKIIRLVIPSDVAFGLLVHDIRIGKECLVNCSAVPAAMFLEDATDAENLMTETIQPGTTVSITMENTTQHDICVSIGAVARVVW